MLLFHFILTVKSCCATTAHKLLVESKVKGEFTVIFSYNLLQTLPPALVHLFQTQEFDC